MIIILILIFGVNAIYNGFHYREIENKKWILEDDVYNVLPDYLAKYVLGTTIIIIILIVLLLCLCMCCLCVCKQRYDYYNLIKHKIH